MHWTLSSRTIVSVGVGLVVAASVVGGVFYVTQPATSPVDAQLVASERQRATVAPATSATDPGLLLEHWNPRHVPGRQLRTNGLASSTQPPVIPLVQVAEPAVQAAAPITSVAPSKAQVEAAPEHDGNEDANAQGDGESQGSDD